MSREIPLEDASPVADRRITEQLDAWVRAVENAVATLNETLIEIRACQERGDPDARDPAAGPYGG